jgi:hypothetical protein
VAGASWPTALRKRENSNVTKAQILHNPRALAGDWNCGRNHRIGSWSKSGLGGLSAFDRLRHLLNDHKMPIMQTTAWVSRLWVLGRLDTGEMQRMRLRSDQASILTARRGFLSSVRARGRTAGTIGHPVLVTHGRPRWVVGLLYPPPSLYLTGGVYGARTSDSYAPPKSARIGFPPQNFPQLDGTCASYDPPNLKPQ